MSDNIDWDEICSKLDKVWDGPLLRIRGGSFSPDDAEEIKIILSQVSVDDAQLFHKKFVSLLWFIPQFMEWQIETIEERTAHGRDYKTLCLWVNDRVGQIIGNP